MPVESYAPTGSRWGWTCTHGDCRDSGPDGLGFQTKEEASHALLHHTNDKHPGSTS